MQIQLIKRKEVYGVNTHFQTSSGEIQSVQTIINSIESGKDIYYTVIGSNNIKVIVDNGKYLRSSADTTVKNNLDSLPII